MFRLISAVMMLSGLSLPTVLAQTPAFPGAVGHGANATGGRSGTVYRVSTLANSGSGSFRDAVSQPNRIIIFDVGGYITLSSEVAMSHNLTIAGQTAPGGGIAIRGAEVSSGFSTNIIIRHVRFRPGSGATSGAHCVNFRGTNGIIDQCSLQFGPWNNIGGVNANQLTIMRSFIADPIGQQFGAHMERTGGNVTWYQNLFANAHGRQPLAKINTIFINNVVYNYQAAYDCGDTSGVFSHDAVGNYFITGPATTSAGNSWYQMNANQSFYTSGNLRDSSRDGVLNGSATSPGGVQVLGAPWSPLTPDIPAVSAATAYRRNLSQAGAWPRDQVDYVILNEVQTLGLAGPYPLPNSQTITGLGNNGFGTINGGITPLDSDLDGMPDYWEVVVGSNPNVADAMVIGGDGYARIEHYLNWLAEPHALIQTNATIDFDLRLYAAGFTNASPNYYLDNATNGSITLVSNHVARFTASPGASGFGGFRFAVVSSDGLNLTNSFSIILSDLPPPSNLTWRGDGTANVWDVGATTNWDKNGTPATFTSGDNVTFDDTGSNTPAINLTAPITAGLVSVLAEQDYTFIGSGFAGGSRLFKVGAGKLTLNNASVFSGGVLINEGVVQLGDGESVNGTIGGNITNQDTFILANPTAATSAASISGSGEVIKRGAGTHTLTGSQTYTNLTTIEAGALAFSGSPPLGDITNAGLLTFNPSGSLTYAGSISGPGLVTFGASSQTITLSGANTFTGGINITAGNLLLANSQAPGTGTVTNSSSGLIYLGNGVVITNDLTFTISTTDLNLRCDSGTATWAGNVTNLGGGVSWRPGSDGGTLIFTGSALQDSRNFIVPRGTFHAASNALISATGPSTALGRDATDGNRSARITLRDNAVMNLGQCSMGGARQGGFVVVTIQDAAALSTGVNNFDLHNVNRATAYTELRLNGGTMTTGGFIKTRTGATQYTTNFFNGGVLRASQNNSAFLPALSGLFAFVSAGGAKIDDNGFNITITAPLLHDPALPTADGGLIKLGTGTLTVTATNTFTGPTHVYEGVLVISGFQTTMLLNTTNLYVAAGAGWVGTGDLPPVITYPGHKLWGNGYLANGNGIRIAGTLEPGTNGIGKLTFNNNLTLLAVSTNLFEISASPLTNDMVKIFGNVTLGGTLVVSDVSGTLAAGDSFKLFDAASYSGAFNTVILPPLDPGLAWNTNQLNNAGILSVVSTSSPSFSSISVSGGNLVLSGTGGPPGGDFDLLVSTNIVLPRSNWTRLNHQFDANGNFSITNPTGWELPRNFYSLDLLSP